MNDHDHDRDRDHANDNGEHEGRGSKIVPAPAGGALTSLAALQTALANVDTSAVIGRSGLPMLLFKSREASGTWMFGQKRTIPEEGSRWAINPLTFRWGCIAFAGNKVAGEHLVSVSQPKPLTAEMQDVGFPWQEEWAVNMKCISGADAGVEVIFKATTDGAIKAVVTLVEQVRDQLSSEQHDGKIAPIVLLEKDSYPHAQYGKVWFPALNRVDWMPLSGPAPAPEPAPTPTPAPASSSSSSSGPQPRRRRVA
jgi:hypothetical protein